MKLLIFLFLFSTIVHADDLSERVKNLENRLNELELNDSLRLLEFGGEFNLTYEGLNTPQGNYNSYRMRIGLDLNAPVSDSVKFYSRLTMDKYFNSVSSSDNQGFDTDAITESSSPYFQRAYVDIKLSETLIFSGGRLPTVEGVPVNYWRNLPRSGTYPARLYNNIFDGLALTKNIDFSNGQSLSIRGIYSPFVYLNEGSTERPSVFYNGSKTKDTYSVLLEYSKKTNTWFEIFNTQFAVIKIDNISSGNSQEITIPNNSVSWSFLFAGLEFKGLANGFVDTYFSVVRSIVNTKKLITINQTGETTGFLNDGKGEVSANSYSWTTKYDLTAITNYNWSFGHEFVHTERNFLNPTGTYNYLDPSRFYATPGDGAHLFFIYNWMESTSFRFGGRYQKNKYGLNPEKNVFGPQVSDESETKSYYAAVDIFF